MTFFLNKVFFYKKDGELTKTIPYGNAAKNIRKILNYISKNEQDHKKLSVGIHLTDSEFIKKLNNEHRQKNSSTDVLSFPHNENDGKYCYIGDIFINEDIISSQAEEIGSEPETEVTFLAMHGMLHLVGYDHITSEGEEAMTSKQRKIFRELGIRND